VQPVSGGPGILRTDESGNVLGGDTTDWCYRDTIPGRSVFNAPYPNPSSGLITFRFSVPAPDTVALYFRNGSDTTFIFRRQALTAGSYSVQFSGAGLLGLYQRVYYESKYLTLSDRCNNFGDILFEDPH
jgi:hypothetical protein